MPFQNDGVIWQYICKQIMEKLEIQGINFRKLNANETCMGIKKKQFIETLEKMETDENGWLNFKLVERTEPVKGFSHYLTKMHKK